MPDLIDVLQELFERPVEDAVGVGYDAYTLHGIKYTKKFCANKNFYYFCRLKNASLAQLVEHDTLNVGVQGSSPWGSTEEKRP